MLNLGHCVYLITSASTGRTYIGYTCNPERRIRQHNGEIVGGAKYTRSGRPWHFVCYITGFADQSTALQYEWINHHPPKGINKHKYRGVKRRLYILKETLKRDRFTSSSIPTRSMMFMIVFTDASVEALWNAL